MTTGPAHTDHPTSTVSGAAPTAGPPAPAEWALPTALPVQDKVRLLTGAAIVQLGSTVSAGSQLSSSKSADS